MNFFIHSVIFCVFTTCTICVPLNLLIPKFEGSIFYCLFVLFSNIVRRQFQIIFSFQHTSFTFVFIIIFCVSSSARMKKENKENKERETFVISTIYISSVSISMLFYCSSYIYVILLFFMFSLGMTVKCQFLFFNFTPSGV